MANDVLVWGRSDEEKNINRSVLVLIVLIRKLLDDAQRLLGSSSSSSRNHRKNCSRYEQNINLADQVRVLLLKSLRIKGSFDFDERVAEEASRDFGQLREGGRPLAVMRPGCTEDIAVLVKAAYNFSLLLLSLSSSGSSSRGIKGGAHNTSKNVNTHTYKNDNEHNDDDNNNNNSILSSFFLRVAARGCGHSIHGQAQAAGGVVVDMSSLRGGGDKIRVVMDGMAAPYVEAGGGELWIDVLRATLPHGLAPRSWTDYLYLSVGGTLSNAGISGQAFLHGPQITNVYQLEVVTGKGDIVICSKEHNSDLFYAILGGLGQFGIITRACIALEAAPDKVKWIRAIYSNFEVFRKDQEFLISQPRGESFDYVEGFVVARGNSESLIDNWRSSLFKPQVNVDKRSRTSYNVDWQSSSNASIEEEVLYYLEVTKNYNVGDEGIIDEKVAKLLSPLNCIPSSIYSTDISYLEFLDRVHVGEIKLRAKGLWEIPHPWLNLFVPRSKIGDFDRKVFKNLLVGKKGGGPIIIYPMNRSKWDDRMSAIIPDEEIFYLVALLCSTSGMPGDPTTEDLLKQNEAIFDMCRESGVKQYLPTFQTNAHWRTQFGEVKWTSFVQNKANFDPCALLAPAQKIFLFPLVHGLNHEHFGNKLNHHHYDNTFTIVHNKLPIKVLPVASQSISHQIVNTLPPLHSTPLRTEDQ